MAPRNLHKQVMCNHHHDTRNSHFSFFFFFFSVTETEKTNKESKEHQEIELHRNDLGLEDSSSSPRGVLGNTVMASDTDNSSSNYSSCSSCSSDDKSSSSSPFSNTSKNVSSSSHGLQWNKMFESIKKKSIRRFTVIPLLASYELTRKNLRRKQPKLSPSENGFPCERFFMAKPSWRNFTYEELAAATDDFNPGKDKKPPKKTKPFFDKFGLRI